MTDVERLESLLADHHLTDERSIGFIFGVASMLRGGGAMSDTARVTIEYIESLVAAKRGA